METEALSSTPAETGEDRAEQPNLPNFLVIGAAKSGTTSLWHYLKQHPDIFMADFKEPRFFAVYGDETDEATLDEESRERYERLTRLSITSMDEYRALFADVDQETAVGEATPFYLYSRRALENIRGWLPDGRFLLILRNPADRAFSDWAMQIRTGRWERLERFEDALEAEDISREGLFAGARHYQRLGFYHRQLRRWLEHYDISRFSIHLYDDFARNPMNVVRPMYEFLGVDPSFTPDISRKMNAAGAFRGDMLGRIVRATPAPIKNAAKSLLPGGYNRMRERMTVKRKCSPETRQALIDLYREDITALQDLIGRDLSHWLR